MTTPLPQQQTEPTQAATVQAPTAQTATAQTAWPTTEQTTEGSHHVTGYFSPVRLGRDYGFLLPGFFLSLAAFIILVPLTALAAGTFIIWLGGLLLPLTLAIATAFAQISRARLAWWTGNGRNAQADSAYRSYPGTLGGWMGRMADPRRWLDLLYETLIAFPLHIATFSISIAWGAGAAGGITYGVWGLFLPRGPNDMSASGLLMEAVSNGLAPDVLTHSFALDLVSNLVWGVILLVTLPAVVHGLAWLDAIVMAAALGGTLNLVPGSGQRAAVAKPGAPHSGTPEWDAAGEAHVNPSTASPATVGDTFRGTMPSAQNWAWIAAGFLGALSLAVGWPVLSAVYHAGVLWGMLLALGHACALAVAVRWRPLAVAVDTAVVLATVPLTAAEWGAPWPWPVVTLLLHVAVVMLVALRGHWGTTIAAWALPLAATTGAALVLFRTGRTAGDGTIAGGLSSGALANLIVVAAVSAAAGIVGVALRALLADRAELDAQRRAAREAGAERAELAERNRIAQELHDVVAHSMSVISVQATTAPYRLPGLDEDTRHEFESIAGSSRTALSEMRGLLAILRAADGEAPTTPQPTLGDVPELIETTRNSGVRIVLHTDDPQQNRPGPGGGRPAVAAQHDSDGLAREGAASLARVPAATSLTGYRVVQEGLSNALRHAPGAHIDVVLRLTESSLEIDVVNGPVPPESEDASAAPGAGLGLKGIRERTDALGGAMRSEPMPGGGFDLHAELPL